MRLGWLITWLFIASLVITPATYSWSLMDDPVVERSMSPDSDSWGVAIFGGPVMGVLLGFGIVSLMKSLSKGTTRLDWLSWRHDRMWRSAIWTVLWAGVTAAIVAVLISDFLGAPPAYEFQILPFYLLGMLWLAVVRALVVSKGPVAPPSNA